MNDVDDSTKQQMQAAYDAMGDSFDQMLQQMQLELPELEYFRIDVCEEDGDVMAFIKAGN